MYSSHIDPQANKVPELSAADIDAAQSAFMADVERELRILGERNDDTMKMLLNGRDRMEVKSYIAGPTVRFKDRDGAQLIASQAAKLIADTVNTRNALLTHGPDPVALVVERLVSLGVDRELAERRAQFCIRRMDDGRVARLDIRGEPFGMPREWPQDEPMSDEQKAQYKAHHDAVTLTTKRILGEIEDEKRNPRTAPERLSARDSVGAFL